MCYEHRAFLVLLLRSIPFYWALVGENLQNVEPLEIVGDCNPRIFL